MVYKIALAQLALKRTDLDHNHRLVEEAIHEAASQGAELVLLPELWASGFDLERAGEYASVMGQGWFKKMSLLAADNQVGLGGSLIENADGKFYNTFALYASDGSMVGTYRKIHLFRMLKENQYLQSGDQLEPLDTRWGRLGLSICYDLRFPEVFRKLSVAGVEIILLVAEWPEKRIEHWKVLLKARAIENQVFIAAVNKVGESLGAPLGGASCIVNPMGEVLTQGSNQPEILIAEVDLAQVGKTRLWMPVFHDRKPGVY